MILSFGYMMCFSICTNYYIMESIQITPTSVNIVLMLISIFNEEAFVLNYLQGQLEVHHL